ncbi:sigma-70 family RNA polymerase sigma factor [Clostridium felsineum]|uniref:RNA polymerase sigma factor SigY n=1 Tax=Clostridium felsineum TaxID=36839 RepID=A0A1S8MGL0_9CLOT|nr:sigma-70 family RNA polymerase sigma factor [Clostridium felsineum]MCR3760730.1 sigma-70 family RNA polymerase sigma factor [Clostridium felsineum]URZ03914.1 RNA polymerase sigma factor SigY [Clostridium felsineum]URZ07813.1 RNA polymerase sigma factor SigY [Clostridium felsineum]URZ12844.1 RNA polymerase sigma factor SigY [Clostridium felsineum]URZ15187.1 RNA polymerase sigma factor SigY [Clostridium felsineum DSM 794]
MEEKELVKKAQLGSSGALNTLFQMNYKLLFGFLIKTTGDISFAEDLVQETFMKAVININKFRGESKFLSWLIAIALNLYKNEVKRQSKFETKAINEIINLKSKIGFEERIGDKLEVMKALKELQKMSYEKRVTFILKYYYGYSIDEISKIIDCKEGTVKSRLHNTVKVLRSILGGDR